MGKEFSLLPMTHIWIRFKGQWEQEQPFPINVLFLLFCIYSHASFKNGDTFGEGYFQVMLLCEHYSAYLCKLYYVTRGCNLLQPLVSICSVVDQKLCIIVGELSVLLSKKHEGKPISPFSSSHPKRKINKSPVVIGICPSQSILQ